MLTKYISTPLLQDWLGDDAPKRLRREIHFPSGRFGEAVEQAQAVLFLASDESSFVNGTDFVVDGGLTKVRSISSSSLSSHPSTPIANLRPGICDSRGPSNCRAKEHGFVSMT